MFLSSGGTAPSSNNIVYGYPNQDAFVVIQDEDRVIAVLCDGCHSSHSSELGSKWASRLIAEKVRRYVSRYLDLTAETIDPERLGHLLERVRQDTLAQMRMMALEMGDSLSRILDEYFYFTIVGAIALPSGGVVFNLGDGVYSVDDELIQIGPFPGNEPPYLAYGIVGSKPTDSDPSLLRFNIQKVIPAGEFDHLMIGSDGVADLATRFERKIPGQNKLVGPISQFWQEDIFMRNEDMIRRRLTQIGQAACRYNKERQAMVNEAGQLADDTTIVVIRKAEVS